MMWQYGSLNDYIMLLMSVDIRIKNLRSHLLHTWLYKEMLGCFQPTIGSKGTYSKDGLKKCKHFAKIYNAD